MATGPGQRIDVELSSDVTEDMDRRRGRWELEVTLDNGSVVTLLTGDALVTPQIG